MKEYSYLNCSVRLPRSFTEVPCLSGSGYHVYTVEPTFAVPNSCRVVKTVPIPFEYSPYLADNSFGLGLTWNILGHEDSHEAKVGSLQTETEQETDCFTMAHVKGKFYLPFAFAFSVPSQLFRKLVFYLHIMEETKVETKGILFNFQDQKPLDTFEGETMIS